MGDFEMVNQRSAAHKAARRKEAIKRMAICLSAVLVAILACVGFEYIGFISEAFLVILAMAILCYGSYKVGYISRDIQR